MESQVTANSWKVGGGKVAGMVHVQIYGESSGRIVLADRAPLLGSIDRASGGRVIE